MPAYTSFIISDLAKLAAPSESFLCQTFTSEPVRKKIFINMFFILTIFPYGDNCLKARTASAASARRLPIQMFAKSPHFQGHAFRSLGKNQHFLLYVKTGAMKTERAVWG
ncbi:hypothetical protein C0674_04680 [Sporolactobacillus terrae]|uniref:Uncharacterized protein n=1 Tax=Sporolactobacillus terrae TaxID=269673 RepID=A0ABX5Q5Q4_9BACL|nr:hypothetical protein C0674_04680 [Sporolactobacillus terrae]QAA24943.1 hypothetical protein C0679_04655 [Sporolactobacillus terrae]